MPPQRTYRSTNSEIAFHTLVNGQGLPIFADRVDANRRIRTASDNSSSVGRVSQHRYAGRVCSRVSGAGLKAL